MEWSGGGEVGRGRERKIENKWDRGKDEVSLEGEGETITNSGCIVDERNVCECFLNEIHVTIEFIRNILKCPKDLCERALMNRKV